jgi:hypothetical protein
MPGLRFGFHAWLEDRAQASGLHLEVMMGSMDRSRAP